MRTTKAVIKRAAVYLINIINKVFTVLFNTEFFINHKITILQKEKEKGLNEDIGGKDDAMFLDKRNTWNTHVHVTRFKAIFVQLVIM